jgi:hypothetical protein
MSRSNDLYYIAFFLFLLLLMSLTMDKQTLYYFLLLVLAGVLVSQGRNMGSLFQGLKGV